MIYDALFGSITSQEAGTGFDNSALTQIELDEHLRRSQRLFKDRREIRKLEDGCAIRFPGTIDIA